MKIFLTTKRKKERYVFLTFRVNSYLISIKHFSMFEICFISISVIIFKENGKNEPRKKIIKKFEVYKCTILVLVAHKVQLNIQFQEILSISFCASEADTDRHFSIIIKSCSSYPIKYKYIKNWDSKEFAIPILSPYLCRRKQKDTGFWNLFWCLLKSLTISMFKRKNK